MSRIKIPEAEKWMPDVLYLMPATGLKNLIEKMN
jgi:hypothetical protein